MNKSSPESPAKEQPELECSNCKAIIRTADDLGYGFKGTPYVGATHVCDRFEYGLLRAKEQPGEQEQEPCAWRWKQWAGEPTWDYSTEAPTNLGSEAIIEPLYPMPWKAPESPAKERP